MTPAEREAALARCDAEIARIAKEGETGEHPAWLIALGLNDWQIEKSWIAAGVPPTRAMKREDANA